MIKIFRHQISFILIFFSALLIGCNTPPEESKTIDYTSAIDSSLRMMQKVQLDTSVPGLAMAVSVDGKIVWMEGIGYSDIENRVPVDPAVTMFRIGSVSKPITTTAMALLLQQGKLNPDALIQTYVSYFPEKKYPITVRQVAGHIAGIRHYRGGENISNIHYETVKDGISIFAEDSLLFQPGSEFFYSSYGWNLISAVVEGASNEDFLTYMQQNVFSPLNLNHTMAEDKTKPLPGLTHFYTYNMDSAYVEAAPEVDNSYKWAGGGFVSTVEDLIAFGNAWLDTSFISISTREEFITPQMVNDTTSTNYGMGWVQKVTESGRTWFGHSGGSIGGITQLVIYPKEGIVVALLSNSDEVNYNGVEHKIAQQFIQAKEGMNTSNNQ